MLALLSSLALAAGLCPAAVDAGWREVGAAVVSPDSLRPDYGADLAAQAELERLLAALQARGITVAVALIPTRPSVLLAHTEQAVGKDTWRWADDRAHYLATLAWLRRQGVVAPDLLQVALQMPKESDGFFRPDDGHWTMDGARAAAQAVATAVEGAPGSRPWLRSQPQAMRRSAKPVPTKPGDLTAQVAALCKTPLGPGPELYTYRPLDASPAPGLLDEVPPAPVASVAASFGSPGGFYPAFLGDHLDAAVLNVWVAGGRTTSGLRQWLESPEYAAAPPKLLVWTFPVDHLHGWAPSFGVSLESAAGARQLIPLVDGGCDDKSAARVLKVRPDGTLLAPDEAPVPAAGHYVQLDGGGLGRINWTLRATHADGTPDRVLVEPDPRIPPAGRAFVELRQDLPPVMTLKLDLPAGTAVSEVRARVCSYRK